MLTRIVVKSNAKTFFICISAMCCPKHTLRPRLNPRCVASITLIVSASAFNHLSGRKASASSPKAVGLKCTAAGIHPTLVPSGKKVPDISAPPEGTFLSIGQVGVGKTRIDSLMTALRYGSLFTSAKDGGRESCASRSSWVKFFSTSGCFRTL